MSVSGASTTAAYRLASAVDAMVSVPGANRLLRLCHDRFRRPLVVLRYVVPATEGPAATASALALVEFERQMAFLKQRFAPVPLSKVARYLSGKQPLPQRPVVVTLDVGDPQALRGAAPFLESSAIPATVFLGGDPSNYVAAGAADVISRLASAGIEFGWHVDCCAAGNSTEPVDPGPAARNRVLLEGISGRPVVAVAYATNPTGGDAPIYQAALAGYRIGVTLRSGVNWLRSLSPMTLRRQTIPAGLSARRFGQRVEYPDWTG